VSRFLVSFGLALLLISFLIVLTACGGVPTAGAPVTPTPTPAPQPVPAKPTITLTASPTTITAGQYSTLQWTSTGGDSITFSPPIGLEADEGQTAALNGSAPVVPTTTTTYTATVSGAGGSATASVTITVNQPPPKISSFTALPATITAGQTASLSWTVSNAKSVTIDNGVGSGSLPTGTATVKPAATTTYTATVIGLDGSTITATATVNVEQSLAVSLSASPAAIGSGQTSTLTWSSQGAASVNIQPDIGAVSTSGSIQTPALTQTTVFTATATDALGDTRTSSATVTVVAGNGLQTIKHIIVFVQENRSFDNYFGHLGPYKVSRGFTNDVNGTPADAVQYDQQGVAVHPYHYQTVCVENTSPSWNPSWGAYDLKGYTTQPGPGVNGEVLVGGTPAMNGFVTDRDQPSTIDPYYHRVMGYYDQTDIPYYYEAATQFATSDTYFEAAMAGTIPNRMYLLSGTSEGHIFPDSPPPTGWPQPTIFDLLNQYGVSWRYYYQDNSIFLAQFSDWSDPAITSNVWPLGDANGGWYSILASPTADQDLPSVVFIEHAAELGLDEHPGANVQLGAADAANIINALLASPAWRDSVLILTYDEFGGLYDHVPIMAGIPAPDDIAPIASAGFETPLPGDFIHSGFRLPIIVFSPWVKPHFVSHVPRDHTSILKLIETRFGLPALTRRDAWADDMTGFFDFTHPAWLTPPPLPAQPTSGTCDESLEIAGQN
jgi:phospholipase C